MENINFTNLKKILKTGLLITYFFILIKPLARLPMQSEDPYYFFYTHYVSQGEIKNLFIEAFKDGFRLGHTNPIGSIFFHFYFFIIHSLADFFNVNPWLISGIMRSTLILVLLGVVYAYLKNVLRVKLDFKFYCFLALTIYFGTIQFHSPWAHDFSASGPAQGILTPILMITNILLMSKLIQNRFKKGSLVVFIFTIGYLHVYELQLINLIYLPLMLLGEKDFNIKSKALYIFKFSVLPFILWVCGKILFSENSDQYSGTMLSTPSIALKTSILNILSSFPTSAWKLTSQVIPESFDIKDNQSILIILVALLLAQIPLYKYKPIEFRFDIKFSLNFLYLFLLMILSSVMHGITLKNAQDVSILGQVYFSYGVGFVVWFIAILVIILRILSSNILVKLLISIILIPFFAFQFNVNYTISHRQVSDYDSLEKLINSSIAIPKSVEMRCKILTDWQPEYTDSYYSNAIINGLNYFSQKEINSEYCPGYVTK